MIRFARSDAQRGAQTVEYALITIVAATVAALALAWARGGGIAAGRGFEGQAFERNWQASACCLQ